MQLATCKNCKSWEPDSPDGGTCDAARWVDRGERLKPGEFGYFIQVNDDSGLWGGVRTSAEFGCVKFHKKGR